ncbi:J domain-containing protein [Luteibacter flocculans]|uniref:J domain-containing protein n=1 Tax=Luteibacter flocculans TaxID=2780091 RepID=A0ABY4T5H2_9GAMM|nr:J domain-containing protein [Luteibacter flocculans]URL58134.1 J domain-containing protein [Luteibacter flocculans]
MTSPFEALGLPEHADLVAVRRAYATALRRIDPAVDPEAFAQLRDAYETARRACESEQVPETAAEMDTPAPPNEAVEEKAAEADVETAASTSEEAPPPRVDPTVTLAWRFAADVGARRPEAIPHLLGEVLAELRTQYIDAPGVFEEYLIDLIGLQRIGHRAAVFAAAEQQFHWHEVGRLASLGQRGQWIEVVMAQREAWSSLAEDRRREWLALFERAEAHMDTSLVRHWPEIRKLNERFPGWLSLHVSGETLQAWRTAYEAQPTATRDMYEKLAPTEQAYLPAHLAAAREKANSRRSSRAVAFFLLAIFVGIVHLIGNLHSSGYSLALPTSPPLPDTPRQCAELYAALDRPDAFAAKSDEEVGLLKSRADACARRGHWHAPTAAGTP